MLMRFGNLCITAHNYDDNRFFSNLFLVDIDDIINIHDMNGNTVSYIVYEKYETYSNDIKCTSQDVQR